MLILNDAQALIVESLLTKMLVQDPYSVDQLEELPIVLRASCPRARRLGNAHATRTHSDRVFCFSEISLRLNHQDSAVNDQQINISGGIIESARSLTLGYCQSEDITPATK